MAFKWERRTCSKCEGSGREDAPSQPCEKCEGTGRVHSFLHGGSAICRRCYGRGQIPYTQDCTGCEGKGYYKIEISICDICRNEWENCHCNDDPRRFKD